MRDETIPSILCIDFEPDDVQVPRDAPATWNGVDHVIGCVERLRGELGDLTGEAPRFTWFLRMDAQIAACEGRLDFVPSRFEAHLARLVDAGDALGLHVHPFRWSDERGQWVHELADDAFITEAIAEASEAFEQTFGEPPRRQRFGTGFLSNGVLEAAARHGAVVDVTLEPGHRETTTTAPNEPMHGCMPNTTQAPRIPYRPSTADFRVPGSDGPDLAIVPLATTAQRPNRGRLWHAARTFRRGLRPPEATLLPGRDWGDPQQYWDIVERKLSSFDAPHFATAIRTLDPAHPAAVRMQAALAALPRHRLGNRLTFVDPIDLVSERGLGAPT